MGTRFFRLQVPGDDQGSWYAEVTTATAGQRVIASFGEAEVVRSSDGEASVELRDEDFHGSVPRRTHAEIKQKVEVEYVVNHPTRMLRSTAAMLPDDWSNPTRGARVLTNGGAIQYFSRDKESIR
jgi:hypothetical protein